MTCPERARDAQNHRGRLVFFDVPNRYPKRDVESLITPTDKAGKIVCVDIAERAPREEPEMGAKRR